MLSCDCRLAAPIFESETQVYSRGDMAQNLHGPGVGRVIVEVRLRRLFVIEEREHARDVARVARRQRQMVDHRTLVLVQQRLACLRQLPSNHIPVSRRLDTSSQESARARQEECGGVGA